MLRLLWVVDEDGDVEECMSQSECMRTCFAMAVLNVALLYPDCIVKTVSVLALRLKVVMPNGLEY